MLSVGLAAFFFALPCFNSGSGSVRAQEYAGCKDGTCSLQPTQKIFRRSDRESSLRDLGGIGQSCDSPSAQGGDYQDPVGPVACRDVVASVSAKGRGFGRRANVCLRRGWAIRGR